MNYPRNPHRLAVALAMGGAMALLATAGSARGQDARPVPTAEELRMIAAAAPGEPYARPARPRRVLVFGVSHGEDHTAIPFGRRALEILGKKTGAFEAVVSDDLSHFAPGNIKRFDAIVFNNAGGEVFLPREADAPGAEEKSAGMARDRRLKASLLAWVRGGGGLVGIHAAAGTFPGWPAWAEMLGGRLVNQPWNETVTVKNDDPTHPVNAAFGGKGLRIKDEVYQFGAPYSREHVRVLLSLDVARTKMNKIDPQTDRSLIQRADGDFALSWVRREGKGRVFYCAVGHRHEIYWKPQVLGHLLAGIQYAAGDLKADAAPSAELHRADHPAAGAAGFVSLLNGKDLTGWTGKAGSWAVENGSLARKGGGDLWTKGSYGDFVLDLEFQTARDTNSGVLLRCAAPADWEQGAVEIQIKDSYAKATPNTHDCGAIFDCAAPAVNPVRAPGYWNRMTITARGAKLTVVLNRKLVLTADLARWSQPGKNPDGTENKYTKALKDLPRRGRIGLQDHGYNVWFRNLRIKPLD